MIEEAERFWFREIQADSFPEELRAARRNIEMRKNSRIGKLTSFLDKEGLLRAKGRVTKLVDCEFNNSPIILDGRYTATKMLLIEFHRRFFHGSNETIVNEIRQKYHVTGIRNALRSVN